MKIDFGNRFKKALDGLPPDRKKAAIAAIGKFQQEPALPALKFRPLAGKGGHFIISAHHGDRIIMKRIADEHYELMDVGPHDNVYRRMTQTVGTTRLGIPFPNPLVRRIFRKMEAKMRAIVVVGVMVAAGSAWGQQTKTAAIDAIASSAAGASWCGLAVQPDAVERALAASGFDRSNKQDSKALDDAFETERNYWQIYGQSSVLNEQGKAVLSARCGQLIDAYGPEGVIRKGLLSKK